jgi:hypothetical protein
VENAALVEINLSSVVGDEKTVALVFKKLAHTGHGNGLMGLYITTLATSVISQTAWEEVKKKTDAEIEKWIGKQLDGTSVTVVLIGAETSTRQYVGYEIEQSHNRGNGMLGVYIHNMKDVNSKIDAKGTNPLSNWHIERDGKKVLLSDIYPTYDWVNDDGYHEMGDWIEAAAKKAGR